MKTTYADCIRILDVLRTIAPLPLSEIKNFEDKHLYMHSVKFSYAVAKNINKLEGIVNRVIKQGTEPTKEYQEFLMKREELNIVHAEKDKDGNPLKEDIMFDGRPIQRYVINGINNPDSKYNKAAARLKDKYALAIEEMINKENSYKELLKEVATDFQPFLIDYEEVPKGLSIEQWGVLLYVVKSEENETV